MPPPLYLGLGLRQRQPPLVSVPLRPGLDPPPSRVSSSTLPAAADPPPSQSRGGGSPPKSMDFAYFLIAESKIFACGAPNSFTLSRQVCRPIRARRERTKYSPQSALANFDWFYFSTLPTSALSGPPPLSALSVRWRDDPPWSRYLF